jgi:hypothetical protein
LLQTREKNARCYGSTMSHRKENRREEIKKKKKLEGTKGYMFDINESKVKVLNCYTDMKDNKTKMK